MPLPAETLVPPRILGAVDISGRLVHRVTYAHSAVGIHAGETIVLVQLGLQSNSEGTRLVNQIMGGTGSGRIFKREKGLD